MNIQTIQNASDLLQLYAPLNLFLKPQANVSITITLPLSVGTSAKAVSNFDVMDKLRQMVLPDSFSLLKVSSGWKTMTEFLYNLQALPGVKVND
jgi:arginine/serine-rich splicing factor 17